MRETPTRKSRENPIAKSFKSGKHDEWNSEAGRVRGIIVNEKHVGRMREGYTRDASKDEPHVHVKSDKTASVAIA